MGRSNGGFSEGGGVPNSRSVLKPDVAIASEVSILSKNSLAITDFHAKKTQHVQLFENPLPGTPPFAIPKMTLQPEIIAKLIPKTLSHETEMRISKKIIPKQFVHVIL